MTFASWPATNNVPATELARNGFYYLMRGDEVKCAFCNVIIMSWQTFDDIAKTHKEWSPQCHFVLGMIDDIDDDANIDVCGTGNMTRLKHPQYETHLARVQSFANNWPTTTTTITAEQLADAGFFYEGPHDRVCCFYSDCILDDWLENDDAFVEHERWFPTCGYVHKVKEVHLAQRTINETSQITPTNDQDLLMCKICYENRVDTCFMPCGHVVSCFKCAVSFTQCPLCRRVCKSVQKLFFA
jgi:baculoviral IAP repeat-containing protein 7/8